MAGTRQSDSTRLLESTPTSQQQLMGVQQKSLSPPHGCHRISPRAPALKPRVFPPPQNASWPVSPHPLGTSAIKVSAGASFKMPNMGRRSQNSESCQRKPQENCKRCNTPEGCMDQHSDPAAGLGSALRSLALHTSVTRRCHLSG